MYNNKLKITVVSNIPSKHALMYFQKKLYKLQKSKEFNQVICPIHNSKAIKP